MTTNYIEPETSNVIGVQFGIMGPDEILKNTVVEVEKHDTFKDDKPVVKGLFDIQMGTTDNDKVCGTCNQRSLIPSWTFWTSQACSTNLSLPVYYNDTENITLYLF